ncbi:kappa-type opioid receptor [Ciona intestinalis]
MGQQLSYTMLLVLLFVYNVNAQLGEPSLTEDDGEYAYFEYEYKEDYDQLSDAIDKELMKMDVSPRTIVISIIYCVIVVAGLVLNVVGLVMTQRCTVIQYSQKLFMQNLCISSLLLVTSLAFSAQYRALRDWRLGSITCKLVNCLKTLSMFCQCYFAVAVAADYVVMRKRPGIGNIRRTVIEILTVGIGWMLAAGFSVPMLVFAETDAIGADQHMCTLFPWYKTSTVEETELYDVYEQSGDEEKFDDSLQPQCKDLNNEPYRVWVICSFALAYAAPLLVSICLCVMYKATAARYNSQITQTEQNQHRVVDSSQRRGKKRRKPASRFIVGGVWVSLIELAYFLCWLPLHIYHIGRIWGLDLGPTECLNLRDFSFVLGYASCLVLPSIVIAYSRPGSLPQRSGASSSTSSFTSSSAKSMTKGDVTPEQTDMHLLKQNLEDQGPNSCTAT